MFTVPLKRVLSEEIYSEACLSIPGGVNSPVRAFSELGQTPLVIEKGCGDRIVDVDGYSYIDYCGSWGALIHGHAHPRIIDAAVKRASMGSTFGIATSIESKFASFIVKHLPWIEKIRFVSSGTESAMSAIRLARGYTGKDIVIKFAGNYHGHSDSLLAAAGSGVAEFTSRSSSVGVPAECVKSTLCLPYNNSEACRKAFKQWKGKIAAVIVEPIAANMGLVVPSREFLETLREESQKDGALLIFDEVISGFRVAFGGAAHYFGIIPDLCCYGKIIGGGFAAAAFGGKEQIMSMLAPQGPVYQAGTLSGNPVAMESGYATLLLCQEEGFYQRLESKTAVITEAVQQHIQQRGLNVTLHTVGSLFTLFFGKRQIHNFEDALECDKKQFKRFFQILFQKGIYLVPSQFETNFVSDAHTTKSLCYTRDSILEALDDVH